MSVYMITYFLSDTCGCGEHHNHKHSEIEHSHAHIENSEAKIVGTIKSLGSWAQVMPEGFLIKSSSTADEILTEIKSIANRGDIMFVTKVDSTDVACTIPAALEWISDCR